MYHNKNGEYSVKRNKEEWLPPSRAGKGFGKRGKKAAKKKTNAGSDDSYPPFRTSFVRAATVRGYFRRLKTALSKLRRKKIEKVWVVTLFVILDGS
jgi:hypothetical protein